MNAYTSFHCTCLVTIEQGLSKCSTLRLRVFRSSKLE